MLLGPPCRTISALRYQGDDGPGVLRDDEHPYGRPDLSPSDMDLVEGDVVLWFRGLSLFVLTEDVRDPQGTPTQLVLEQAASVFLDVSHQRMATVPRPVQHQPASFRSASDGAQTEKADHYGNQHDGVV